MQYAACPDGVVDRLVLLVAVRASVGRSLPYAFFVVISPRIQNRDVLEDGLFLSWAFGDALCEHGAINFRSAFEGRPYS